MPQSLYLLSSLLIFLLQFKSRKEDRERERKGSIPFHHTGKKRQRRMGVPFLLHEDHLDVSPTRSTFSFGSFSGIGEDRRGIERGGWQTTILGEAFLSLPQVLCHFCSQHSENGRGSLFLHPSYCSLIYPVLFTALNTCSQRWQLR